MSTDLRVPNRPRARLTRQGQITVPKAVRDALGVRPGDDIEFVAQGENVVLRVRPRRSVLDFDGIASAAASRVPRTAEELDEMIARGMIKASIARAGQKRAGSPSHS